MPPAWAAPMMAMIFLPGAVLIFCARYWSLSSTRTCLTVGNSLETSMSAASKASASLSLARSSSEISSSSKIEPMIVVSSLNFSLAPSFAQMRAKVVLIGRSARTKGRLCSFDSLMPSIISPPVVEPKDLAILLWKEERMTLTMRKPTCLSLMILTISVSRQASGFSSC